MKAYSMDLRERVIAACDAGETTGKVADLFGVCPAWIRRLKQRRRELGVIGPLPHQSGRKRILDDDDCRRLRQLVAADPDATLEDLRKSLAALGLPLSIGALFNTLRRLKLPLKKKTRQAAEQDRPDVREKREQWPARVGGVGIRHLVFLDETWTKTNMTRLYGRCPLGERLVEKVPHGHWKTTTLLTAIRSDGPFAATVLDGSINAHTFVQYVQTVLAPELQPGDVVIMDNLSAHKAAGVSEAIEAAGAKVLYLPPYSPDLNPIENMFSKVKQHLRAVGTRTLEAMYDAIGSALQSVTPEDCRGYFGHCGYAAT